MYSTESSPALLLLSHTLWQEDIQEDFGWKLVHGDVFRPPTCTMLLSVCVGSGAQLLVMTIISLGWSQHCALLYIHILPPFHL